MMSTPRHAVILGGSIAGLLTARVLTEHYEQVTVVDRDDLEGGVSAAPRRGVPQGRHAHGLLATGRQAIEDLLPGATKELIAGGVPSGDVAFNLLLCANGHRLKPTKVGLVGLNASR